MRKNIMLTSMILSSLFVFSACSDKLDNSSNVVSSKNESVVSEEVTVSTPDPKRDIASEPPQTDDDYEKMYVDIIKSDKWREDTKLENYIDLDSYSMNDYLVFDWNDDDIPELYYYAEGENGVSLTALYSYTEWLGVHYSLIGSTCGKNCRGTIVSFVLDKNDNKLYLSELSNVKIKGRNQFCLYLYDYYMSGLSYEKQLSAVEDISEDGERTYRIEPSETDNDSKRYEFINPKDVVEFIKDRAENPDEFSNNSEKYSDFVTYEDMYNSCIKKYSNNDSGSYVYSSRLLFDLDKDGVPEGFIYYDGRDNYEGGRLTEFRAVINDKPETKLTIFSYGENNYSYDIKVAEDTETGKYVIKESETILVSGGFQEKIKIFEYENSDLLYTHGAEAVISTDSSENSSIDDEKCTKDEFDAFSNRFRELTDDEIKEKFPYDDKI